MGDAAVRRVQPDGGHNPGLGIGPARAADPRRRRDGGVAALGADDEGSGQDAAILQADRRGAGGKVDPGDPGRRQHLDALAPDSRRQGGADAAVLDHVAQGLALGPVGDLRRIEPQEGRRGRSG